MLSVIKLITFFKMYVIEWFSIISYISLYTTIGERRSRTHRYKFIIIIVYKVYKFFNYIFEAFSK